MEKLNFRTGNPFVLYARYGFFGFLRLAIDTMVTKFNFSRARIIRRPFYIRGQENIDLGNNFTAGVGLRIDAFSPDGKKVLRIGDNVEVNDYVHIGAICSVKLGNNVLIASKVFISDHNHGTYSGDQQSSPDEPPSERELSFNPVEIEDNVWVGENVAILPGVRIGRGAIIGANSVITRSVPAETIFAGNPARKIKVFERASGKWVSAKEV